MSGDLAGYLAAFGSRVRHNGRDYLGIVDDDYESSELGTSTVATNSITLLMTKADAAGIDRGDTLLVYSDLDEAWIAYYARTPQGRTDGFTLIPLNEAS